jgi:pantothenate kinase type III
MLLAIDAGNTNLVFALVEDGVIRARWRIATDPRRTADQYAVWLHQLLALEGFTKADVGAVIIGTVVPRALHNLEVLARNISASSHWSPERRRSNGGSSSTSPSRRRSAPTGCST